MTNWRPQKRYIFIGVLTVFFIIIYFYDDGEWEIWNRAIQFPYAVSNSSIASTPTPLALQEEQWEDPGPYYVDNPKKYKIVVDDTPVCRSRNPFLLLMIPVAPGNVKTRDAIRHTWGSEKMVFGREVDTIFLLGMFGDDGEQRQKQVQQENEQHRDIIQSDFRDSYHNLTIKTMLMLQWVVENCKNTSYIVKIDSDMFVHVPNLVKLLLDPKTPTKNYMSGLVWWQSPVIRDSKNKFFLPREVFAEPVYPPYPLGMVYIMSLDLPGKLLKISPQIKPIYIEDAYLGMCLRQLGISPTDPPESGMFIVSDRQPVSNCTLTKVVAMMTPNIQVMMSFWDRVKDPDTRC